MHASLEVRRMSTRALLNRLDSDLLELESRTTGSPGRPTAVILPEARHCLRELRSRVATGRLFED